MNFSLPKKNAVFVLFLLVELAVLSGWLPNPLSFWVLGLRIVLISACLIGVVTVGFKRAPKARAGAIRDRDRELTTVARTAAKPVEIEGRDLACLYHEIRNCTSTLKGNTLLMKQKLPSGTDNSPLDRIERVTASIERIAREVMELTDPSLVEPSRFGVCLTSVIKECIGDYFPNHTGFFRLNIPESLPVLEGDPGKLRQAFINLYRNSLEAQATQIMTRVTTSGENISVYIEDNGVGCAPSEIHKIFLPSHTSKKTMGGMGMGLYLVKSTIENHGGTISVSARKHVGVPLGGLIMHITFPVPRTQPSIHPKVHQLTGSSV